MAIFLDLEYGGQVVASAPIELTNQGHVVRALISAEGNSLTQTGHIWFPSKFGGVGHGMSGVNSEVDQQLRILLRAETNADLVEFQDFVQLRTAIILWLYSDDAGISGTGIIISKAELEVPLTALVISHAELEVPEPLRLVISHAELEVSWTGLFVAHAELEVPHTGLYISHAELQVPSNDAIGQEGGGGAIATEDGGKIKVE